MLRQDLDLAWMLQYENIAWYEDGEVRVLARGIDRMPEEQRKAIMNMMMGLYPGIFEKGTENDDT